MYQIQIQIKVNYSSVEVGIYFCLKNRVHKCITHMHHYTCKRVILEISPL